MRKLVSVFSAALFSSVIGSAAAQGKEPKQEATDAEVRPDEQPASAAAAGCRYIGSGKYNCNVWREAISYWPGNVPAGVLHRGTNYFYCQATGSRQSVGPYTNYWWALTDDDSGNSGVWVNVVNISGGDNDEPIPGLSGC